MLPLHQANVDSLYGATGGKGASDEGHPAIRLPQACPEIRDVLSMFSSMAFNDRQRAAGKS
jgi:hypothetical protein